MAAAAPGLRGCAGTAGSPGRPPDPWLLVSGVARAAFLATVIVLGVCLGFYLETGDAIDRMLQTAYPGDRASAGGDYPIWRLLSNGLWVTGRVASISYEPTLNSSEKRRIVIAGTMNAKIIGNRVK